MAKKRKNSNYGGYTAPKKTAPAEPETTMKYGLPGSVVLLCLAMLVVSLILQPGVESEAWRNILAYFLTGASAVVLAAGQYRVKQENSASKTAGFLMVLFVFIGALYLISGVTTLGALLRG